MKEDSNVKKGSKWSEIENEGGDRNLEAEIEERNLENRCVVGGNECAFKKMKEGVIIRRGAIGVRLRLKAVILTRMVLKMRRKSKRETPKTVVWWKKVKVILRK